LSIRQESKQKKDWETADKIRNQLSGLGFEIKDGKDGFEWTLN
jgi:cysteinyl-tRNA synthetase